MIIRELRDEDLNQIQEIHEKYYKEEFDFPNFYERFLGTFVAIDEDEKIISAGGIRLLAESILITDRGVSVKKRREALYHMLQTSQFVCERNGFDQLGAFIQDSGWKKHLIKAGFAPCKGDAIYINF